MHGNLFEHPSLFHQILSLSFEEVHSMGLTIFKRLKHPKNKDFMLEVYFLLRKGFDANTIITHTEQNFDSTATSYQEMFKTKEIKYHCFDTIIDLFDEYSNFEEEALLYFHLCGIDLDLPCRDGDSLTLREKIRKKWDEFENFEDVEEYSFAYILNSLGITNINRYGIDLENRKYLIDNLTEECRLRCIKMYANSFVSHYTLEEAVKSFNLELIARNKEIEVNQELVKFLLSNIEIKSAYDSLLLLCNRMISLSSFDIQNIPHNKREQIVKIYKTPMYITNPNYKQVMFETFFGKEDIPEDFLNKILKDEQYREELIEKHRNSSKRLIIEKNTNVLDLHLNHTLTIVNETDLLSENVFDYPSNCVFTERRENLIYVFTCSDLPSLRKNGKNPYTNESLLNDIPHLEICITLTDFFDEMINGKKLSNQNINQTDNETNQIVVFDLTLDSSNIISQFLTPSLMNIIESQNRNR